MAVFKYVTDTAYELRQNIMKYVDIIGRDLAEMIIMSIAEDIDDMEGEENDE